MTLTDAPNDLGGRFFRNCARTTPELPLSVCQPMSFDVWNCFLEYVPCGPSKSDGQYSINKSKRGSEIGVDTRVT